jgi:hypothetical protein
MHGPLKIPLLALPVALIAMGGRAGAQPAATPADPPPPPAPTSPSGPDPRLSLDPTTPQVGALPGGITPAYGQKPLSEGEWRFDFHGFITAPLAAGIGSRGMPAAGQSGTTLHTPPVVPDDRETFSHTGVTPTTYAQLNFSQGNNIVAGNMSIVARQAAVSTSFLEPVSQLGVTDLFLSILPKFKGIRSEIYVGAFTSRYGSMGEWDEGRYGTPLIARVNGVGERIALKIPLGNMLLIAEQGLVGQSNKANAALTPDVWNDFGNSNAGSTFVHHGHVGLAYNRRGLLGLHYLRAWSQDDRANPTVLPNSVPDGSIDIYGADVRLNMGRFGHAYFAGSYTDARYVMSVSRVISILNTRGGQGLIDNYFGPASNGNGKLTTFGGQYDLSIGKLVSYPVPFSGDGPDLFVSVYGMITHVDAPESAGYYAPNTGMPGRYFDNVTKRKYGLLATYSFLPWLAASGRLDQVDPDTADTTYSFGVLSSALIFRTDWMATDQIVLQYSRWFHGSQTLVRAGDPPQENINIVPDNNMVSLSASMWW